MSYPDVVIACIEHISKPWKHSEQLRQRYEANDNTWEGLISVVD